MIDGTFQTGEKIGRGYDVPFDKPRMHSNPTPDVAVRFTLPNKHVSIHALYVHIMLKEHHLF
jgi:hypothetical protein